MKETLLLGCVYNEDAWETIKQNCRLNPLLEKRYAVCYEKEDDFDWIYVYTDDIDFGLAPGQFLVDTETLQVVNQYDLKGYFDRLHQRLRDNLH